MDLSDLSPSEIGAARRVVAHCEQRWDAESQTLFGLDRLEFRAVLAAWPQCLTSGDRTAALAVSNSLSVFVYGMPPSEHEVPEIIGITHAETESLFGRLRSRLHAIIDQP